MEKILKQVPLFAGLGDTDLAQVAGIAEKRTYDKNVTLFDKGDPGQSLMILLAGRLRIFLAHEDGREITLTFLKPYGYLGEVSLLDDGPRSASVQAVEKSEVCIIHKERFRALLVKHPGIALTLLEQVSRIVRTLTEEVDGLSFHDVYGRVARKIWSLVAAEGAKTARGLEVRHELTHQELANMVGSARETVTKVLGSMEADEILVMDRRVILVKKPEKLREYHQGGGVRFGSSVP